MTKVNIENFIECVKGYPILYNRRHKDYNSIEKKTLAWELISKEMNESSEILKNKWKGLKDGYTKYKRFLSGVAPSNKSYHSWCWSKNLKFLDNYMIYKKYSKYKKAQTSGTSSPSPPRQSPTPSADEKDLRENIESEPWTVSPATQYESQGSRRSLSVTDEEFEPKHQKLLDPVDHLFTSYAGTFRRLSLKSQCMIKVKMARIFAEAELAEFGSVTTNGSEVINVSNDNSIDRSHITTIKMERI
ncbi:transcription factor Adf-1-like [Colias croceus]|uniref:transcription factor Adf-1-like n=1 Tax=Colias crocea TaxID=72248 RepID=UPI001E27DECB|nr:transcription factor Adf-1-like [Colias croceus]